MRPMTHGTVPTFSKAKMNTVLALLMVTAAALIGSPNELRAQEHGAAEATSDHAYHKNHAASLLGASTSLDTDATGLTIGTEYTRRWGLLGVGLFVEMSSSRIERDVIIGVPLTLYPWRRLILFAAPAAEVTSENVEHGGETALETEFEPLFRLGTAYWFELNETIAVAPTFMADVAKGHWTLVYGLSFGVGW